MANEPKDDPTESNIPAAVEFVTVRERHKTLRTCVMFGSGTLCVISICLTITAMSKPAWLGLVAACIAPGSLTTLLTMHVFRKYVERNNKRTRELEESIDPDRTSSGLDPMGRGGI